MSGWWPNRADVAGNRLLCLAKLHKTSENYCGPLISSVHLADAALRLAGEPPRPAAAPEWSALQNKYQFSSVCY
jgi:hypothetical protein